jgi:tetratricopeptide (TPR) repeat protein
MNMARKQSARHGVAGPRARSIPINGKLLGELREKLRVINRKVDGAFGISYRSLSGYENNQRPLPVGTLAGIFKEMRTLAKTIDARKGEQGAVTVERSMLAEVLDAQRKIVIEALNAERGGGRSRDLDAERGLLETLEANSREDQALRDSFSGQPETADLKLATEIHAARERLADLLRQQAWNWIRNTRFSEAIAPLRQISAHVPATIHDKLALVQALRASSKRVDDEAGREIARLHAEATCEPNTADWVDLQVSMGKTAFAYDDLVGAESAFRRASEAALEDQAKLAEPLGHLAVLLYQLAETQSASSSEKRARQEQARLCWEKVLICLPKERFPQQYAVTEMRLGNYWSGREAQSKREVRDNLIEAYRHYEMARQIWETENNRAQLGAIEYTIADWELKRAKLAEKIEERRAHIQEAVRLCNSAIRKLTPEAPLEWHNANFNLAEALEALEAVSPSVDNLEKAALAYQAAADVFSGGRNLEHWTATMLPLCRVKAALARTNRNSSEYRSALHATLQELESARSDDTDVRKQIEAIRKELPLDDLHGSNSSGKASKRRS